MVQRHDPEEQRVVEGRFRQRGIGDVEGDGRPHPLLANRDRRRRGFSSRPGTGSAAESASSSVAVVSAVVAWPGFGAV